ncbi:MAG: hypothetical protein MK212_14610, partial [Saprospiraceae bacterium]|nr:hypothetical protein [Saprospiraceae bacterium]
YLGGGTYTQLLPMMLYTYNHSDPSRNYNRLFGVKSINTNLGYLFILAEDWRLKIDGYLQYYRNVPVDSLNPAHSFMNYGGVEDWRPSPNMNSDGRALNFGGEISVEKFFSKGYYFNVAASYVNVAYWSQNSPNTRYRSAFDNTWVIHLFGGKEFRIGKKRQNRFSINAKIAFVEGQRVRPILEAESANSLYFTIYDDTQGYRTQLPFNLRSDIKFTFLFNTSKQKLKLSHRLNIEVINVSNYNNIYGHYYNHSIGRPAYYYNYPILPNIGYNLRF